MLSVAPVHRGGAREAYYEREINDDRELYYAGEEGSPGDDEPGPVGRWTGSGAASLGLSGEVDVDALRQMWEGKVPGSDVQLRRMPAEGGVSALDLTFRPPKSVSVVFAVADSDARAAVGSAHDAAVDEALGYLEREACFVRRGHAGVIREPGGGFVVAAFQHHSSRAGDPLLHTHAVVANMAEGPDGRWTALDGRALFGQARTAGFLYQAALRANLSRELGVEWGPVREGTAEIVGVPRPVVEHFSRRRAEIVEAMAVEGGRSARSAQLATVRTRRAKEDVDPVRQREEWRARASEFGFGPEQVRALTERERPLEPSRSELVGEGVRLAGAAGLTRRASTFDRRDVLRAWAAFHGQGASVAELESVADQWLDSRMVREVEPGELSGGSVIRRGDGKVAPAYFGARYSTAEMLEVERELVEGAAKRRGEGAGLASGDAIAGAVARRPSLRAEQAEMVRAVCSSGDGVGVVIGRAGTGKTYALVAAREAWEHSGLPVAGAALSASAARVLESEAGIPSRTVAQLKMEIERWGGLDVGAASGGVLVVDEAGMVGTRDLKILLDAAAAQGIAVRLVGDYGQLPEIDAGGGLRGLAERLGAVELREQTRQRDPGVRAGLELLREGEGGEYLVGAMDRGAVTIAQSPEAQRAAALDHWWTDVRDHGHEETVLLAARHAERRELNALARERMREQARLGERELEVGDRTFAEGDRVVALRNQRAIGLLNGDRGTVQEIGEDASLWVKLDSGRQVHVPAAYLEAGRLDHGYALTVHKAQGQTVERAHFLGDESVYREQAYTAATRGREETRFYVVAPDSGRDHEPEGLAETKRALGESRAKELALDVEARAQGAREASEQELERRAEEAEKLLAERRREAQRQVDPAAVQEIDQRLRDARQGLEATRERIDEGGWRARRDPELRSREAHQEHAVEQWQDRLEEARDKTRRSAHHEAMWFEDHRDTLADGSAARDELDRRAHEQTREAVQAAPYEPGQHITELIGERSSARDVGAWDHAARRIETYHQTHQPDKPHVEPPEHHAPRHQGEDWQQTAEAITRTRGEREWQQELERETLARSPHRVRDTGLDIEM